MHPAISVIFFTVTSGAGFGFIALIGLGLPMPEGGMAAFIAAAIGGGLSVAGLVSSTFHLGHPERAWRAFSQWRSSWLSREGVCAVITLTLFGVYTLLWVFWSTRIPWLGYGISVGAVATVFTTSMIYAQLKTVPLWNNHLTPICYLLFAATSGLLLVAMFGYWTTSGNNTVGLTLVTVLALSWGTKIAWWRAANGENSLARRGSDTGTATGLGNIGTVRLLEKPHSGENYLTKEMVFQIGRKHAYKLKIIALVLGALVPVMLTAIVSLTNLPAVLLSMAFLALLAGLFVERWLFFAEARHAVSLYY
ncbi:MAG: DmsC/YnfH family molybdoenzyme membrane anchor subunit [Pseudomonadota bacterium]